MKIMYYISKIHTEELERLRRIDIHFSVHFLSKLEEAIVLCENLNIILDRYESGRFVSLSQIHTILDLLDKLSHKLNNVCNNERHRVDAGCHKSRVFNNIDRIIARVKALIIP